MSMLFFKNIFSKNKQKENDLLVFKTKISSLIKNELLRYVFMQIESNHNMSNLIIYRELQNIFFSKRDIEIDNILNQFVEELILEKKIKVNEFKEFLGYFIFDEKLTAKLINISNNFIYKEKINWCPKCHSGLTYKNLSANFDYCYSCSDYFLPSN